MKLADFIVPDAIIPELAATDRNEAIRELVEALAAAGKIPDQDPAEIAKTIIKRENQSTTGMGRGVAVPHCKLDSQSKVVAAFGRAPGGLDFSALDRAPVYLIFLLLSPVSPPEAHLAAMESIFTPLQRSDNFRRFLRQATSRKEIVDVLNDADSGVC